MIRLGYACISNIINTTSSKSVTLGYFNKIDSDSKYKKIDNIILENLSNLESLIRYNIRNNIHFFRISSKLIPLIDIYDIDLDKYSDKFFSIGKLIRDSNMRVDVHADQYCVLNSVSDDVIFRSINILNNLKRVIDMFGVSYNIILHIGSKKGGIKRFIYGFGLLDDDLKKLIILENDDKNYNVYQTLKLCEKLNIPMCLDIHHHYCNRCSRDISFYLDRIYKSFDGGICKMHFSSPKSRREFRSHSEFVNSFEFVKFVNILKKYDYDTYIMIEAKGKDLALVKLVYELKFISDYRFIDESSFIL